MDDLRVTIIILFIIGVLIAAIVLPIVALVMSIVTKRKLEARLAQSSRIPSIHPGTPRPPITSELAPLQSAVQQLAARIETIEGTLAIRPPVTAAVTEYRPTQEEAVTPPAQETTPPALQPEPSGPPPAAAQPIPKIRKREAADLESIIGRRWLGWIAVVLILFATSFFLKYAFDNRWIGELGRVTIGIVAGLTLTVLGFRYHQRRWRIFSQILTAGGVILLYVSVYAAFGYYHLVTQKAAFTYLLILIAEAAGLAVLYDAQAIAIMALIGGFLSPVLLRSDRDQYRSLFGYIAALDIGALALPKHWPGLHSLAFLGTHLLFWMWYVDNYHPRKLGVVLTFQAGVFLIFLLAPLGRQIIKRESVTVEQLGLFPLNAFLFFATSYHLLNPDYHDWMGVFAIVMALIYAGSAKVLLDRGAGTAMEMLLLIGVALVFVTLAIPIQLKGNWITIVWSLEALTVLWVGFKTASTRLQYCAYALFVLALGKLVFWDTPFGYRPAFTPVVNKYFLSALVVTACLFAAAALHKKWEARENPPFAYLKQVIQLAALATLWFVMSVETSTFFRAQTLALKDADEVRHKLWLGQMALSVLWSGYAGVLAAIGFVRRSPVVRWAALSLFALTVVKVLLVDMAQLKQLYRITAFLVLGILLLVVAWGYHKAFRSKESSK